MNPLFDALQQLQQRQEEKEGIPLERKLELQHEMILRKETVDKLKSNNNKVITEIKRLRARVSELEEHHDDQQG